MNQQSTYGSGSLGQIFRSLSIQFFRQQLVAFGSIHIGIGSTIDNHIHLLGHQQISHGQSIANIKILRFKAFHLIYIGKQIVIRSIIASQHAHFITQLTVRPSH